MTLVKQLEVGRHSLFYLPTTTAKGRTMKLVTGANLWAARLIGYIYSVKAESDRRSHLQAACESATALGNDAMNNFFLNLQEQGIRPDEYAPGWLQSAFDLQPFSAESWPSWFEVA